LCITEKIFFRIHTLGYGGLALFDAASYS